MNDEYDSLIKNNNWSFIPRPAYANIVRCMWLFRHKVLADGTLIRYKARLVANGSTQLSSIDVDETFIPCKYAINILERAHMAGCNLSRTPVDTESKLGDDGDPISDLTLYQSLAGSLQYLTFTRHDISYAVQQYRRTKHIEIDIHSIHDLAATGEAICDDQEDSLTTAMMLLARTITQCYSTPTNNRLRTSLSTRNQAIIQADHVDIQSKNVRNSGRGFEIAGIIRQTKYIYSDNIIVGINIDDLTIEQYLRLTSENQTPSMVKKVDDMTINEYMEYKERMKRQYSRSSGSYFPTYSSHNTTIKYPSTANFNVIQSNIKFSYDSEDMELDKEVEYTTDEESGTSKHEALDPTHANDARSLDEELSSEEDLDEWLKGELEKHMKVDLKNSSKDMEDTINDDNLTSNLPNQSPLVELNPGGFLLPFTIGIYSSYAMANIDASNNAMPRSIFEEEELWRSEDEKTDYEPPFVDIKTFEVIKYSFKRGHSFICITKHDDDAFPLGRVNGARFKAMIRKELKDKVASFRYSDTTHLSRSVKVLKLKNFKKDATLKLFKNGMSMSVQKSQVHKMAKLQDGVEIVLG
ncbi:ribonuclease H-like domain-containing protein [Tanacetum coccineum]